MLTASLALTATSPPTTYRAKAGTDAPYATVVLDGGGLIVQSTDPAKLREAGWALIHAATDLERLISLRADVDVARQMNAENELANLLAGSMPPPFPRPLADGTAA